MSLFETINGLQADQLASVADTLGIAKGKEYESLSKIKRNTWLKKTIKIKLIEFYKSKEGENFHESHEVLSFWSHETLKIFEKRTVKAENQSLKTIIIGDLRKLRFHSTLNDSDFIVSIVRDILLLLWEESSKKEKEKFIDIVKKELESHNLKFTEDQLDNSMSFLLAGGIGGVVPFAVPLVAGIMLQQLTKGFIAWFLINVMGQRALQIALLSTLTGPIGWGVALGTGGLTIALSVLKFKNEQDKLRFVQAVLSIYAYRYQNQFQQRRKAS